MAFMFEKEYFPKDSIFLEIDERKTRLHMPTNYQATNMRANWFFNDNVDIIEGKKVLDLGCYSGLYSYVCLELGASEVYGIDLSEKQIQNACEVFSHFSRYQGKYTFEAGDLLEKLKKIPDNSFDTTLLIGVLYFIPDGFQLIREIYRVTKESVLIDTMSTAYLPLVTSNTFNYSDYIKFLNHYFIYFRNRHNQDFEQRGFSVKTFAGEQSMTYYSQNYLKKMLHIEGFETFKILTFKEDLGWSYQSLLSSDSFQIKDSPKLKVLFNKIRKDFNFGVYPYFLNARYTIVAKKILK